MPDDTNGWQPIETAPRDRSDVLTCTAGSPESVRIDYYSENDPHGPWLGDPTHWRPRPDVPDAC